MKWRTCVVLLCVTAVLADPEFWTVPLEQGPVRGRKHSSGELYEFYNIPYATGPRGLDKFKPPQEPPTWTDPFDATSETRIICPQNMELMGDMFPSNIIVTEDCLIANVFVPIATKEYPENTETTESTETTETTETTGNTETPETAANSENRENRENTESTTYTENTEDTEGTEATETTEATESTEATETTENPETPEIPKNLSVLVYVHGGGFIAGYGDVTRATQFMREKKDFILVTFNYRVGIHGFLCLGTEDIPGNAGMKDQVALLNWVKQNIASFGGNPDDVTLAGCSAGSASVELLMLSKSAEGLFHRVIPESGGSLAAFTIQRDPYQIARSYALHLNTLAMVYNLNSLEQFYKATSIDVLTKDNFAGRPDSTFLFSPCIERDAPGAFLTESPLTILKRGDFKKLPVLYGFADMEGLLRIGFFETWKHLMNEDFSSFLPADLQFQSEADRRAVANRIKTFYFGAAPVSDDTVLDYVNFFSDVIITSPMLRAAKLFVEAGNDQVYLYNYTFVAANVPPVIHTDVRGADHCAQTAAWLDGDSYNFEHHKMRTIVRVIWHNFIKTGKPLPENSVLPDWSTSSTESSTVAEEMELPYRPSSSIDSNPVPEKWSLPDWPAANAERSPHMILGEVLELGGELLAERGGFWDEIYETYYRDAIPPRSGASSIVPKNLFNLFVLFSLFYFTKYLIV